MKTRTRITPQNAGGGRQRNKPAATLYPSGQLTLTVAALDLFDPRPARVYVDVNEQAGTIWLSPAPDDADGEAFSLSGGGNTPARIGCRTVARDYPALIGKFSVLSGEGGIVLQRR